MGLPLLFTLFVLFVILLAAAPRNTSAQAVPTCDVVIALDKSSSIGADNLDILKDNIKNLLAYFSNRSDVRVAYWSFSHSDAADFNQPRHDYVSTDNTSSRLDFVNSLPTADQLEGQTDYAQAYGYSAGDPDPDAIHSINDITLTPNNAVSSIRSQADVVVMLTDGEPNYPGGSNNNPAAVYAGRKARLSYSNDVRMVGGYITDSNTVPESLYETINGPGPNNRDNVGPVTFGDAQIYEYVRAKIEQACGEPPQVSGYALQPKADANPLAVRKGSTVNFGYQVQMNSSDSTPPGSQTTGWKLYDVTIKPEVTGNPLDFTSPQSRCGNNGGGAYCDDVTGCGAIYALMGGAANGTCDTVSDRGSGTSTFNMGQNLFYSPNRNVTVGDYPGGTRICSILVLDVATQSGSVNRASSAACSIVGYTPLVQVYGGDVRAGRYFADDTSIRDVNSEEYRKVGVYTSQFKINENQSIVPNGRTYGSWVEYGVLAPGPIEKIASLAGFAGPNGGYDATIDTTVCDTALNHLTFANDVRTSGRTSKCGYYPSDKIGSIPDIVSAVTTKPVIEGSYPQPFKIDSSTQTSNDGKIYKTDATTTNFEIGGGDSKLEKSKSYIIYVPNGTVTISSNIDYAVTDSSNPAAHYSDIKDIPQLVIIAKDINIKEGVRLVNAWLIAAGDGDSGGKLDTCTGYTGALSASVCRDDLTINGPVMARDLDLWRTKVSLNNCVINQPDDCSHEGDPAEMINLPGSTILWTQGFNQNAARARTTSTVELPPYF